MSAAFYRWLGAATLHCLLITPALAIDEGFGDDTPASSTQAQPMPQNNTSTPAPQATNPTTGEPAATNDADNFNNDDPLTFHTLQRITLKNLNINASAEQPSEIKDPFQPINRKVFQFNDVLDRNILLPIARNYKKHVPDPIKTGVSNFFSNLGEPWDAVNLVLQGQPKWAYNSVGRFTVNTVTSLGLADYATKIGLERHNEDFGQTLGKWGVRSGPFVMLPFLGPSTFRDSFGRLIDQYGRVQHYMDKDTLYWSSYGLQAINKRAQFVGVENIVQGDQYTLLRDLYLQRRQFDITGKQQSTVDNSFGDEDATFGNDSSSTDSKPTNTGEYAF